MARRSRRCRKRSQSHAEERAQGRRAADEQLIDRQGNGERERDYGQVAQKRIRLAAEQGERQEEEVEHRQVQHVEWVAGLREVAPEPIGEGEVAHGEAHDGEHPQPGGECQQESGQHAASGVVVRQCLVAHTGEMRRDEGEQPQGQGEQAVPLHSSTQALVGIQEVAVHEDETVEHELGQFIEAVSPSPGLPGLPLPSEHGLHEAERQRQQEHSAMAPFAQDGDPSDEPPATRAA